MRANIKQFPAVVSAKEKKIQTTISKERESIAMEPENKCEDIEDGADMDEGVTFYEVSKVVTGWALDFLFASLCRLFKEGKLDEFDQTLLTLEGKTDFTSYYVKYPKTQCVNRKDSRVNNGTNTTNYDERFENALGVIIGFNVSETHLRKVKLSF